MLKKRLLVLGVVVFLGLGFGLEVRGNDGCQDKEEMDDCTTTDGLPGYCSYGSGSFGHLYLECRAYSTGPTYEICTDANSPNLGMCRNSCVDGYNRRYKPGDPSCPSGQICCRISVHQNCNPLPSPCGTAAGCVSGQICKSVPGIGFNCESDNMGVCGVNNCNPPSQCFEGLSNCPQGWMRYSQESCGEHGWLCCRPVDTECPSPAECLRGPTNKVCPDNHTLVPGACPVVEGKVTYCCLRTSEDPDNPDRPWWENPWVKGPRDLIEEGYDTPPPEIGGIGGIVTTVMNYLFPIAGFICLIFIIQGGYMWMISSGNPESLKKAQGTLTWAVIGLVLTMTIFGILTAVINFLYK
jgi:hypothetical protein